MENIFTLACIGLITVVFVLPMWVWIDVSDRRARIAHERAIAAGRHEPVTIQPLVDPKLCVGSGSCVSACPEDVLRVIGGQAVAVNMAACIGHGACVTACPVGAIQLVFGSEARGIEIPEVGPDFQTNVPGLYIAGELAGMGLIGNAVEQGVQALGHAARGLTPKPEWVDVAIVGAGPAGIGAAAAARLRGISAAVFEQEALGGAVRHYPRKKLVLTRPIMFPGYGRLKARTLRKEQLEKLFFDVVQKLGLVVHTGERVDRVAPIPGGFEIATEQRRVRAQRVILALGRRGTPRKLDVPGEERSKVAYALLEPDQFQESHVLVVGGGDSAVEAALALAEQRDNVVTLSYRGDRLVRPKDENLALLRAAQKKKKVRVLLGTTVVSIGADRVVLARNGQELAPLPNDFVFVFAGGVLPTDFLQDAGVRLDRHFGKRKEVLRAVPTPAPRAEPPSPASPAGTGHSVGQAIGSEPTVSLVDPEATVQLPESPA